MPVVQALRLEFGQFHVRLRGPEFAILRLRFLNQIFAAKIRFASAEAPRLGRYFLLRM